MIIKHNWKDEDGDERLIAIEVSDIDGKLRGLLFKGKAKDWNRKGFKAQEHNLLERSFVTMKEIKKEEITCKKCSKKFYDTNYNKVAQEGARVKREYCNDCIDILWNDIKNDIQNK